MSGGMLNVSTLSRRAPDMLWGSVQLKALSSWLSTPYYGQGVPDGPPVPSACKVGGLRSGHYRINHNLHLSRFFENPVFPYMKMYKGVSDFRVSTCCLGGIYCFVPCVSQCSFRSGFCSGFQPCNKKSYFLCQTYRTRCIIQYLSQERAEQMTSTDLKMCFN